MNAEQLKPCPFCGAQQQAASASPDVGALAQFIRSIDGWHSMGAGVLAEHICEWFAALANDAEQR